MRFTVAHKKNTVMTKEAVQEVLSPVDGAVIERVPMASAENARALVAGMSPWRVPLPERQSILRQALEIFRREALDSLNVPLNAEASTTQSSDTMSSQPTRNFAGELARCMGRPVLFGVNEVNGFVERFEALLAMSDAALRDEVLQDDLGLSSENSDNTTDNSNSTSSNLNHRYYRAIRWVPLERPVLLVTPWNYPYLTVVNALVPALLCGNSAVLKPAIETLPMARRVCQALWTAGVPESALSILVAQHDHVTQLIESGLFSHVHFTGSPTGGRAMQNAVAKAMENCGQPTRLALELGGCDAAYVHADADVNTVAPALLDAAFYNSGQSCCGLQRIYAHSEVLPALIDALKQHASQWRLGNPLDPATVVGPVVRKEAGDSVRRAVADDVAAGAQSLLPQSPEDPGQGAYVSPQLLLLPEAVAPTKFRLLREEVFGPVAALRGVSSPDEAATLMDASPFGLTASVWTRDPSIASLFSDR